MRVADTAARFSLLAATAAADVTSGASTAAKTRVRGIDLTGYAGIWDSTLASAETRWASTLGCDETAAGRPVVTNLRLPGQYDERLLSSLGLQGPYYNWNRWYLPSVGRYLELDPIALKGAFNGSYGPDWYSYANGNPVKLADPTGLLVTGVYDCKTGQFTVTDLNSGASAQMLAESGGTPYGDPIPDGLWEILERQGRDDFFRLDAWDSNPRNDVHDPTGRDHFRLHRPGRTVGCIAAKDWSDWGPVRDLISKTRTETVIDQYRPWWKFWGSGAPIKKFGNIFVVNCGP